jgi:hypothetical protein
LSEVARSIRRVTRYDASNDFQRAEFHDVNLSGAVFREADLSGVRMYGVVLADGDIDGYIRGLRINGVEVEPLVEAELDRQFPERTKLRPTDPGGMREALAVIESLWAETVERVRSLPEAAPHRSVNGEWSFTETLRHLVFVTDAWFGQAIQGESGGFHPWGVAASFITNGAEFGIDAAASPTFEEVLRVRDGRLARLREFLATVTQDDLDRVREPNPAPGWPPPAERTATSCLRVIFNDEWAHHQFAVRDLATIEAESRS